MSPSQNWGTWPGPVHAGVWQAQMCCADWDGHAGDRRRVSVASVLLFFTDSCSINLLPVSKC